MGCLQESYLYKVVVFDYETGCIPAQSICYCHSIDGEYYWVAFKEPILGQNDIRLHHDVIRQHGRIIIN
jgi:hypothetical protein